MKTRLLMMAVLVAMLAGCGDFEWLPDQNLQTKAAGGFVSSARNSGDNLFTTKTDRGVFQTYTSLRVPVQTAVVLEKHFDPTTKLLLGQMLRALDQSILVRSVDILVGG